METGNWFLRHKIISGVLVLLGLVIIIGALSPKENIEKPEDKTATTDEAPRTNPATKECKWTQSPKNPVITFGQEMERIAYNDPSVMKENGVFRMWLSGGIPEAKNIVKIYEASSPDGINWDIDTTVLVEPGPKGSWDDQRTETPNVIKVGDTYHMYYSGCAFGPCDGGKYNLGHATSKDGRVWVKDPKNPIFSHNDTDPLHWGFYTLGEPGAVYDPKTDTIYLYYVTLKARPDYKETYGADFRAIQGVMLATSKDGSSFKNYDADGDGFADAVLTQSAHYPVEKKYYGYSTPYAFLDSKGIFHLVYDVAAYPRPGDWRQVALANATSPDGINFKETESDIFTIENSPWANWEIIGPAALYDNGALKMWFAGHTGHKTYDGPDWTTQGIGYAERNCK